MFDKIVNLRRLDTKLGSRICKIYLKKFTGKGISDIDLAYLNYYNLLINNNFVHEEELEEHFKIKTRHDVKLYLRKYPSSDFQAIQQIWGDDDYKPVVDIIKKNFKPGPLNIIDAGANVGYSSVYFVSQLNKHTISIVAVEPSEENLAVLKMNFRENGIDTSKIEHAGLYNKTVFLNIVKSFRDSKDWSLQVEESDTETSLKAVQVSDLLEKQKWKEVDFFKMDIEGAERFLFEDAAYVSSFLPNIKIIAIEVHHEYNIKEMIEQRLTDNGFYFIQHSELLIAFNKRYLPELKS